MKSNAASLRKVGKRARTVRRKQASKQAWLHSEPLVELITSYIAKLLCTREQKEGVERTDWLDLSSSAVSDNLII
jgi:hypothetical protein